MMLCRTYIACHRIACDRLTSHVISSHRLVCHFDLICNRAEYFLGKQAGAADKMAQLNSSLDSLVVLGSLPERVMRRITWPTNVVTVILAECQTPRLTLVAAAIPYLQVTLALHVCIVVPM